MVTVAWTGKVDRGDWKVAKSGLRSGHSRQGRLKGWIEGRRGEEGNVNDSYDFLLGLFTCRYSFLKWGRL